MTRYASLSQAFALVVALVATAAGIPAAQESGATGLEDAFVRVVGEVRPSVVTVSSRFGEEAEGVDLADETDEWVTTFSGVVFDTAGHIVTVATAVEGARTITVTLPDERVLPATVVGSDPRSNLAVLLVEASGLKPVRLAAGGSPRVGQWVIAVGNPFGLSGSVTYGIVSGVGRTIGTGGRVYPDMIQTTAPVNPGDAGGLAVNLQGEMIGLTCSTFQRAQTMADLGETMKRMSQEIDFRGMLEDLMMGGVAPGTPGETPEARRPEDLLKDFFNKLRRRRGMRSPADGGSSTSSRRAEVMLGAEGINFVMPAARVSEIAGRLIAGGAVKRSFLGVQVSPIDPPLRSHIGLQAGEGVLVVGVALEGPAGKAGLRAFDVLLRLEDRPIRSLADLEAAMLNHPPGSSVTVSIVRGGKPASVSIELGRRTGEDD